MMPDNDELRKWLEDEYGISSDAELYMAIQEMEKIDIGIFVSPIREVDEYENDSSIA